MKKFKIIITVLCFCMALSVFAACGKPSLSVSDGKIKFSGATEVIENCFVRTDPESWASSYFGAPKSADKYLEVLKLFEGVSFSEYSEEFDESTDTHYDTVGLIGKNIKVRIFVLSDGICVAEAQRNNKKEYFKADETIDHEKAHNVISAHLYV